MNVKYDKLVYTRRLVGVISVIDKLGDLIRKSLSLFSDFWHQWKPLPRSPKRVLVLRTEQIGDVVLATPAFQALRERFPDAHITVLVQPATASLLKFNPFVNQIIAFKLPWCEYKSHPSRIRHPVKRIFGSFLYHYKCLTTAISLGHKLSQYKFDVALDLGGHIYSLLVMTIAKAPVRIGNPKAGGKFLLTHWLSTDDRKHEVERCLDIVGLLGATVSTPKLHLYWSQEDETFVIEKLRQYGVWGNRPVVSIHPFSAQPSKCWNIAAWAKTADALIRSIGATIVFVGSNDDRDRIASILAQMKEKAINLSGEFSLLQLAAFFSYCDLFIGVDSGPAHIAAAVGIPVVSVWSSAYLPESWAPRSPHLRIIRRQVPCADCRLEICPKPVSCMDMIEPEEVINAVEKFLASKGR